MNIGFMKYHPLTQFVFFLSVLSVTMLIMHPVFLVISLAAGSAYVLYSGGVRKFLRIFGMTAVLSILIIIINCLVSHGGITVITYLPDGNALTLEAIIFGFAAALLMSGVVNWFYSVNKILTSDRIIYLFGRFSPKLALLISMTLNFISRFRTHLSSVRAAQYALGRDVKNGKPLTRISNGIRIFSAMIQWSLENSVDTADSMKSRGYGLKKRTCFTLFRINARDILTIGITLFSDVYIITVFIAGRLDYSYYPYFEISQSDIFTISVYSVFALSCLLPLIIDITEGRKWKYIQSKI